jgi:hypothetical protein
MLKERVPSSLEVIRSQGVNCGPSTRRKMIILSRVAPNTTRDERQNPSETLFCLIFASFVCQDGGAIIDLKIPSKTSSCGSSHPSKFPSPAGTGLGLAVNLRHHQGSWGSGWKGAQPRVGTGQDSWVHPRARDRIFWNREELHNSIKQ